MLSRSVSLLIAICAGLGLAAEAPAAKAGIVQEFEAAALGNPQLVQYIEQQHRERKMVWLPLKPPQANPTRQDRSRGYILFFPSYLKDILPNSLPEPSERNAAIRMAACRGEYESACFAVHPLKRLSGFKVRISPLRSETGKAISGEYIKIRIVRWIAQEQTRRQPPVYKIAPGYLTDSLPQVLPEGVTQWFWITVCVPKDAKSGTYRGTVRLVAENAGPATFPITVTVRSFDLGSPEPMTYAHYYNAPKDLNLLESELRTIQQYGSNAICVTGILHGKARLQDGKMVVDFSRADRFMQVYKKLGFPGPVLLFDFRVQGRGNWCNGERWLPKVQRHEVGSDEFFECTRQMATIVRDHAKQANWPPVIFYVSSELSRYGDKEGKLIEFGLRLLKTYRQVEGIKLCASINGPDEPRFVKYPGPGELAFWPYLDIIMYNAGVPICERTIALKDKYPHCKLWFQNIGMTRYTEGFMPWKAGAVGRRQYKLDGQVRLGGLAQANDRGIFYRIDGKFLATPAAERMREGVDDMRYIRTLERLVEKAVKSGSDRARQAARAASAALDDIRKTIRIYMSRETTRRGIRPEFKDLTMYDRHRERIAEHIAKLTSILQAR